MGFHPDDLNGNARIRQFYNRFRLAMCTQEEPVNPKTLTPGEREITELLDDIKNHRYRFIRTLDVKREYYRQFFKGRPAQFEETMKRIGLGKRR